MPETLDDVVRHRPEPDRSRLAALLRHDIRRRVRALDRAMAQPKRCSACRKDKPIAAFGAHAARHDGLQSVCRECRRRGAEQ